MDFGTYDGVWPERFATVTGIRAEDLIGHQHRTRRDPVESALIDVNRYTFDFRLGRAWAQIDTKQDAPYYGTWTEPAARMLIAYREGDVHFRRFGDDDSYTRYLTQLFEANDRYTGIDPMCRAHLTDRFKRLGLGRLLH